MDKYPVVHIYGQYAHHMEAIILGNIQGLLELYSAIGKALQTSNGDGETGKVCCNDGEGYDIKIQIVEDEMIDKLPVPYTADYAQDKTGISLSGFLK